MQRDDEIAGLKQVIAQQAEVIAKMRHLLRRLLRGRFGRATEKLLGDVDPDQQVIAEVEAFLKGERADAVPTTVPDAVAVPAGASSSESARVPRRRGARQQPSATYPALEVRTRVVDVAAEDRVDADGRPMVACGHETVETVVCTQPEVFIERVLYPRYRSAATIVDAQGRSETAGVPVPERIVARGHLADVTVHQIVIGKFADALPCNRTLEILARAGCRLSGSVVDGAVAAMGDLLTPMALAIRDDLRTAPVVGVDAAMMRCRDPALHRRCRRTPIYTMTDGTQAWYHWTLDETHGHAPGIIAGFHHWLITDGWPGWHGAGSIGARFAGCWAHARRPFARMEDSDPDASSMVRVIHELYEVEAQADRMGASLDERRRLRQSLSRAITERIRALAMDLNRKHPGRGGHPCGTGARYILNQWFDLIRCLDHPQLRLDNNLAEGDLRMVALIRKNSLYLGAASAGPRFAACLSVLRSCRLARINPADYLADITPALIASRGAAKSDLTDITPKRWALRYGNTIRRAS